MRQKKLLSMLLALMMVMSMFTVTTTTVSAANTGKMKNVIYIIGDGAGYVPFQLTDAVKQAGGINSKYPNTTPQTVNKLYIKDYLVAGVTTYPAGASVTDSAASGTALAVGHKAGLYSIGVDAYLNPKANILEAAELSGKRVGVVSKYEFSHATPAAFTAHYYNRGVYRPMSEQAVYQDYDVNLCPGFYYASFNDMKTLVQQRGYRFVNNKTDLANVKPGDKIWSNLNQYTHPFDYKKASTDANLVEMTKAAVTALSGSDEGFAVMIEAAMIDTGGHDNDALENIGDFIEFDETCKWAIEWAKQRNDTIVVMTADHDTGGMNIKDQATAVSQIRSGVNPTSALTWDSKDHTARNVPLCIYAPSGITMPKGAASTPGAASNFTNYVIDNDDIAPWIADCLGLDLADATDELFVNVTSKGSITPKTDENGATNTCATFKFSGVNVSIEANQSVATINGDKVDLGGQIAVWEPYNNRFYVPQRLLDYMATGDYPLVPLTWCGNVKAQEGFNGYYGDFAVNASASLTLNPGDTASFNWSAPYTGVYGMQIKCSSIGNPTTLRATVGDCYGDYYFTTIGWSNNPAMYQDQAIYFKSGNNTINVENIGDYPITIAEFDFGRLDAAGFDSMDYIDFVKSTGDLDVEENTLITTTAITKMGTAGTFWGNVSTYEGVTNNDNTAITMNANGWATFNVPVATEGLYYLKVKATGNTTLRVVSNDEYYGEVAIGTADQYYTAGTDGDYEIIYLPAGKATVKVSNIGANACTISDIQLGATQDLVDAGITPTMKDTKKQAEWVYAAQDQAGYFNGYTSDGEPRLTLNPGEYTTITVDDIPYTGVYAFQLRLPTISGTAKVRVTTDRGYYGDYSITQADTWTNRMTPPQDQPMYFTTGTNTFYIENTGTTSFYIKDYDIGRMDGGNSMDFSYLLKQTDRIPGSGTPLPSATPTPTTAPTTPPAATATPAPTAAPTPTPTISGNASAWTGRFGDLTSHKNGYVGENYAMTTFTNGANAVEGVDYQATSSSPFNADGSFTMITGDWGKYEIEVPYTGVYAMQVYTVWMTNNGPTTIKVTTEDGYYTEHNLTSTGWSSGYYQDQPIYLKAGKNVITIELVGPNNCILSAIDLGKLDLNGATASLDYLPLVKTETVVEPEPTTTPEPTATPTPVSTVTYTAPYTGAYKVTADKAVTIVNETGHIATLTAGAEKYFYLIKGANIIETTDATATLTFTELANQGVDYIAEAEVETLPLPENHIYLGRNDGSSNINSFITSYEGGATAEGGYVAMPAGSSVVITVDVDENGLRYLQMQIDDQNKNLFTVESDLGYYGEIYQAQYGWNNNGANDGTIDVEYIYARKGTNTFTLTNNGTETAIVYSLRLSKTAPIPGDTSGDFEQEYKDQLNYVNCDLVIPEPAEYTVTWIVDGVTTTETYVEGTTPSYKGTTDKAADAQYTYTFAGWDNEIAAVTGDVTYTAQYNKTVNEYTVTWIVDGVTTTETYAYGATPSYKGTTDKTPDAEYTYTFAGWDTEIATVTGNATYTAQYNKTVNKYTVTWIVDGVTTTETYAYGATPSYKGTTDKAPDAEYTYAFAGWDKEIAAVTGDATYTAQYDETVNEYTVTWIVDGVTTTETYAYGAAPSYKGTTDKAADDQYTYTFTGWDKEIAAVTGDATYTAQYDAILLDGFTGFALNGDTASVTYKKAADADDGIVTLFVAEYVGNKLVQINLIVIDTTEQEVGTTVDYSISLNTASTGTVKAMLLNANLVPLF